MNKLPTVKRSELSTARMVAGNERRYCKIVLDVC